MLSSSPLHRVTTVDSHTEGEPTRVVVLGGPDLGNDSISERAQRLRQNHRHFCQGVALEPRGSDVLVGALLCPPSDPSNTAGVIFFNNVDTLGMCGHGTIGLAVTLAYLGRIKPGKHRFETPVGVVTATLHDSAKVTIRNVPSYRKAKNVSVTLPDGTRCTGDVAWGGNWFFLAHLDETTMHGSVDELTRLASQTRVALYEAGIVGENGAEIDHVEFFGEPSDANRADSRSFVLCPGGQYDRSPCGTGTSAKLACLAADGLLSPGEIWRQESFIGSIFEARYALTEKPGAVAPTIIGQAFVTGDMQLVIDPDDPFGLGIPSPGLVSGV